MSSASRHFSEKGQSTVEAAFALPVLMILVLLLVQPGIVLYDRLIMLSAASEGCRLYATASSDVAGTCSDYVKRRLSAIPQIDQFHVHSGGCSWKVDFSGGEVGGMSRVTVSTEVKPLPILGSGMRLLGLLNGRGNLPVQVSAEMQTQPGWVMQSAEGSNPRDWPGV